MGALDRVLLAAGRSTSEDEVHEFLMRECPWYRNVSQEKNCAHDPGEHCTAVGGKVKLTPRTPEASTVPEPTVPPGGPGLFRIKGRELPPYVQHLWHHLAAKYGRHKAYGMAIGIVKKWAAGINPGGRHPTRTHADVRAAAAKNVAQWEKDKADAHSRGHVKAAGGSGGVALAAGLPKGSITAPGAKPIPPKNVTDYGLYDKPSQTTAASPPLPPGVKLPTAAEMRKLAKQVPDCSKAELSQSARNHLEAAAVKLEKDDVLEALHVLRAAQSDIYGCHKADLGIAMPAVYTANVFAKAPPAEQSTANAAMVESRDREMKWRALEQGVAVAIDKIRRRFYHGSYGGIAQQGRFSAESSLDKVVRLASAD